MSPQELRKKVGERTHSHTSKKKHTHIRENRVEKKKASLTNEERA